MTHFQLLPNSNCSRNLKVFYKLYVVPKFIDWLVFKVYNRTINLITFEQIIQIMHWNPFSNKTEKKVTAIPYLDYN